MRTALAALACWCFACIALSPSVFNRQLLGAARRGDAASLRRLIEGGADVNFFDEQGEDALVHLVAGWHSALDGSFPDVTAASLASFNESLSTLFSHGADPQAACPLLDAAVTSNVVALSRIAAFSPSALGRCVAAADINGETPMLGAVQSLAAGLARIAIRANVLHASAAALGALSRGVGLTGDAPPWQQRERAVSKSALDAWTRAAPVEILLSALRAAENSGKIAEGTLSETVTRLGGGEGEGSFFPHAATPLSYACASGNTAAMRALLHAGSPARASVLEQLAAANGSSASCAHFAAVRGLVEVLATLRDTTRGWMALNSTNVSASAVSDVAPRSDTWALELLDEHGRSALDVAGLVGPAGVETRAWLARRVATRHSNSTAAVDASIMQQDRPRISICSNDGTTPWLRRFNASAHRSAGWGMADIERLAGLPPRLTCSLLPGSCLHNDMLEVGDRRAGFAVPVLSPVQLEDEHTLHELTALDLPFVVQTPTRRVKLRSNDTPPDSASSHVRYLSRRAALAAWGDLVVDVGSIPYATTYGLPSSRRQPLCEFVTAWMGTDPAQRPPLLPSYVFDAHVMTQRPDLFEGLSLLPSLRKGSARMAQFIVGPPLSGAMPHFHGSAANLLIVGLKLWIIVDPGHAEFVQEHALDWFRRRVFNLNTTASGNGRRDTQVDNALASQVGLPPSHAAPARDHWQRRREDHWQVQVASATAATGTGSDSERGGADTGTHWQAQPQDASEAASGGGGFGTATGSGSASVSATGKSESDLVLVPPGRTRIAGDSTASVLPLAAPALAASGTASATLDSDLPPHFMFVQEPGDIVFVPRHWGHAVLNLADSIAVALE